MTPGQRGSTLIAVRLGAVSLVLLVSASFAAGAAVASADGRPAGTFRGCPSGLVALPASGTSWRPEARQAGLHFLRTTYARWNRQRHWRLRLRGATAGSPLLASRWLPSGWIKSECGATTRQRSVVVPIHLPAMEYPNPIGPCGDCARVTLLLGLTRSGWIAWGQY
jgi:hypothetical protein